MTICFFFLLIKAESKEKTTTTTKMEQMFIVEKVTDQYYIPLPHHCKNFIVKSAKKKTNFKSILTKCRENHLVIVRKKFFNNDNDWYGTFFVEEKKFKPPDF